jgi:uncharacterized protein (TIGR02328 family)
MRLWHYKLLPYLPELQFKGQLREMVAILHDLKRNGKTNHLLINRIMEYPKDNLYWYFCQYEAEYHTRYGKNLCEQAYDFGEFGDWSFNSNNGLFNGWHNTEYLRVCMANLYEKHHFGIGKSRITDEEWQRLCDGYKDITGEEYKI